MKIAKLKIENSFAKNNFFVKVFGCQYNEFDATVLANELKQHSLIESTLDEADLVFVLNCSVRKTGVDRAMGFIRNLENKRVFLSGCVLEADKKRFLKKNVELFDLSDLSFLSDLSDSNNHAQSSNISKFIPIMKGCNNFCSYCVVPYTRGQEISRRHDNVILDIKNAISADHKEIWLLGQNVNSYSGVISSHSVIDSEVIDLIAQTRREPTAGWIEEGEKSRRIRDDGILTSPDKARAPQDDSFVGFADLLVEINNLPGDFQIFFTSNHPKDMSDKIIEAVATLPKIAKFIHLPVQSGSDKVLRSMNRPYTKEQYLKIVEKIKQNIPNVKITTDVIVGYPTETEDDFHKTVDIFKKINYFQAYINKYSSREGTAAHKLGDPIPWSEKERRWRILNEIANKN